MKFAEAMTVEARARLVGERLVARRLQLNLPQSEAARRAGVSRDAVQRAERGHGTVDTLLRLLTAYGIADLLEAVLPEPEVSPIALLTSRRTPRRARARQKQGPAATGSSPVWPEET